MLFHLRPGEGEGGRGPALPLLSYWVAGRLFPAPHPRECYVCYHDSSPQVSRSLLVCIPFGRRDVCSWPSHLLLHDHSHRSELLYRVAGRLFLFCPASLRAMTSCFERVFSVLQEHFSSFQGMVELAFRLAFGVHL